MKALEVHVRKAARADIERIVEIERSWDHLSHWSTDSYYRLISEDEFASGYVAEIENEFGLPSIVGFVIFHVAAEVAEIYNIAVERWHARSSVGKHLMIAALDASCRRSAQRIVLEVRKSNESAIAFYRTFDFRITGERKNYYSNPVEDAYVMERPIGSGALSF